jgi:hypothetical protein
MYVLSLKKRKNEKPMRTVAVLLEAHIRGQTEASQFVHAIACVWILEVLPKQ